MQSFTWLSPLIARFPLANKKAAQYRKYAVEKAMKRKHNGSLTKDLFYHLVCLSLEPEVLLLIFW